MGSVVTSPLEEVVAVSSIDGGLADWSLEAPDDEAGVVLSHEFDHLPGSSRDVWREQAIRATVGRREGKRRVRVLWQRLKAEKRRSTELERRREGRSADRRAHRGAPDAPGHRATG
jgi:hypothetical protein